MHHLKQATLQTIQGEVKILFPTPTEFRDQDQIVVDPWGKMAPILLSESFASLIPRVGAQTFTSAVYGHTQPLMVHLRYTPREQLIRLPEGFQTCVLQNDCIMFDKKKCTPKSNALPECFEVDHEHKAVAMCISKVIRAWKDGFYFCVVEEG